ncbi:MAG: hypothetical protein WD031_04140, partial [Gemmatimonadota bacterium]
LDTIASQEDQAAEDAPPVDARTEALDRASLAAGIRELTGRDVESADGATHYDLSLAFKEMGLLEESLAHLAAAVEKDHDPLPVFEVLGEVLVGTGQNEHARDLLRLAPVSAAAAADLVGVYYWRARAEESLGDSAASRRYLELVVDVEPSFRDAAERLGSLPNPPF